MLDCLAATAEGRDDFRTTTAGELAGFWMADPAVGRGEDCARPLRSGQVGRFEHSGCG